MADIFICFFLKDSLKDESQGDARGLECLQYLRVLFMKAAQDRLRQSNTGRGNPY